MFGFGVDTDGTPGAYAFDFGKFQYLVKCRDIELPIIGHIGLA